MNKSSFLIVVLLSLGIVGCSKKNSAAANVDSYWQYSDVNQFDEEKKLGLYTQQVNSTFYLMISSTKLEFKEISPSRKLLLNSKEVIIPEEIRIYLHSGGWIECEYSQDEDLNSYFIRFSVPAEQVDKILINYELNGKRKSVHYTFGRKDKKIDLESTGN